MSSNTLLADQIDRQMSKNALVNWLPIAIVVVVLIGLPAFFLVSTWLNASRAADESARCAMTDHVSRLVDEHHAQFGRYPSSLEDLEIEYFPDGSSVATVKLLEYESDGSSYRLSCPSHYGPDRVYTQNGLQRN